MKHENKSIRKTRELTRHEMDLWLHVTRDVRKMLADSSAELKPNAQPLPFIDQLNFKAKSGEPAKIGKLDPKPRPAPATVAVPPLAPLESKIRKRLARRQMSVDAAVDLHGLRQDEAHLEVHRFLNRCYAEGVRIALIVTGKGAISADFDQDPYRRSGVLRQIVPHWLREPAMRKIVIGFEEAAPAQGGYGALYVRIRRVDHPTRRLR